MATLIIKNKAAGWLLLGARASVVVGIVIWVAARSAIHEIEAAVFLLIAAILQSGGAVVKAIGRVEAAIAQAQSIDGAARSVERVEPRVEPTTWRERALPPWVSIVGLLVLLLLIVALLIRVR